MATKLEAVNDGDDDRELVIPRLKATDLKCRKVPMQKIMAKFIQKDHTSIGIKTMWCENLSNTQEDVMVPTYDFALVTLSYHNNLSLTKPLENPIPLTDLFGEAESSAREKNREIERRNSAARHRRCDICNIGFWPGTELVSTFLNLNTKKLACCNQKKKGVFHVFHQNCAISWILFCEYHIIANKPGNDIESAYPLINSVFCPSCHGSGKITDGDQREPTLEFSVFELKKKAFEAMKEWDKSLEDLVIPWLDVHVDFPIGLRFPDPPQSEATAQEKVEFIQWLPFYRATEGGA